MRTNTLEGSSRDDADIQSELAHSTSVLWLRRSYERSVPAADALMPVFHALAAQQTHVQQLLASFVCFELAQSGDAGFQQRFEHQYDRNVIHGWLMAMPAVSAWADAVPELGRRWRVFASAIEHMDPRFGGRYDVALEADTPSVPNGSHAHDLALLWDDAWVVHDGNTDAGIATEGDGTSDNPALAKQFQAAVQQFLGAVPGSLHYTGQGGFRLRHRHDVRRLEAFIVTLEPLKAGVARAVGYGCLALLFYGTHLRSTNLFGRINQRKQALLRDGLRAFLTAGPQMWNVLGVLSEPHAEDGAYVKIMDVVHDYVCWQCSVSHAVRQDLNAYDPVGRLLQRQRSSKGDRRMGTRLDQSRI